MLEVLAKDTEPSVRCAAVDALVAVVGRVPDASSAVLRVLADAHETHSVRLAAIMAAPKLGDASEAAVASLVRWLREPPAGLDGRQWLHTRERAAWSLGIIARQPQTAVPALLDVVCDEQSYMTPGNLRLRTWAADAIGDFGPAAAFAAEPLVKFLRRQPDLYLSDAIMRTLGCIAASEGIDELLLLLRSCPIAEVRGMAVGGLGHVAERVPAAREALIAAMSGDTDASVRESAVSVSTRFCPRGKGFQ
jgi:HEAT repeat protein